MGVPEYYFAKPRHEGLVIPDAEANVNAKAWSFIPQNIQEWFTTSLFCGSAGALNIRLGSRPVPGYAGILYYQTEVIGVKFF